MNEGRFVYSDTITMVECQTFRELRKMQPFSIRVHSNCFLMIVSDAVIVAKSMTPYVSSIAHKCFKPVVPRQPATVIN